MPTPTYTPLATVTLTSSASSVTFSSIPATYRDLVLVVVPFGATPYITINSDSTSGNYPVVYMAGNGSITLSSSSDTFGQLRMGVFVGGSDAIYTSQFLDYSVTNKHKSILSRASRSAGGVEASAARWASTSAITTLQVFGASGGTFTSGTSFSLYGIAA